MKLTDAHIEELRKAAEKIGAYGKITIAISGGIVDIITEERVRIQNGAKDSVVLPRMESEGNYAVIQQRGSVPRPHVCGDSHGH
jgi:hypothetical protein